MRKTFKNYNVKMDSNVGAMHNQAINPFLVSAEEVVSLKYKPRLWGEIVSSEDFLYVIDVLEQATENDFVELHISSPGGSMDAVSTLIHAMQKCQAEIHVVMTGTVASAATLPMFFADSREAGEFTSFLFHEAVIGTPSETMSASKAYTDHVYKFAEHFLREVYTGFFTEEELNDIFNGKQRWMLPDEVVERFAKHQEYLASLEQSVGELSEAIEEFEDVAGDIDIYDDNGIIPKQCSCLECNK